VNYQEFGIKRESFKMTKIAVVTGANRVGFENGPLYLCRTFVPLMRQQNYGRVVNVSSGAGSITEMKGRTAAYKFSKVALNALTRIVADEVKGYNVKVNSMCPGWVRTDMGGPSAPRSVEEAADTIIWLATLADDGPTGGFFLDRQPISW
jgi:NAD(P)-dependent dehydrogenase (short-subunit alcohol dehydrogenase family)